MRRRLTRAMVLMVLGALVLSGAVTLAVAVENSRQQTRQELVQEAQGLAVSLPGAAAGKPDPGRALKTLLGELTKPMRLQGSAVIGIHPNGSLFEPGSPGTPLQLPNGLREQDLSPKTLETGETVSGVRSGVVFAAAPYRAEVHIGGSNQVVQQAVVLTRRPPSGLGQALEWFVISSVVILALAVVVAYRLGRRFVRPLSDAEAVTRHIAEGDLDARVPEPSADDPELHSLARSINTMADSLARAKGSERQFLQSVSHDLRTPLTSIRGFAEALEDGVTADVPKAAGVIASEARRLQRLVGDLLSLATLQARRFTLQPEEVDLAESARGTVSSFVPAATELGVSLVIDDPSGPVGVVADPDRLAQVTANLVENALRFANHEVRVTAVNGRDRPELWVSDDGPGIAEADLPHVFERFVSSGHGQGRPVGSGLGLAIVSELVDAMGGSVHAESPLDQRGGTRMVVSMPAGTARAGSRTPRGTASPAGRASPSQGAEL